MTTADLPAVNACLNTTSALLLIVGYVRIRQGRKEAHRRCMLGAVTTSLLFLVSYLTYHYLHGSTRFTGEGWTRPVYFTVLLTHTVLATAIVPMVLVTLRRALSERFDSHRRIARWTLPAWLYVSVTGVLVYWMLYHWQV
ncbi:MAG: DUF420 domain-containing protein [candidate division Zixibacteria bacterium]|nr:DUF420 domain-containing protein [candidate division Zixibacteria bacterium]